MSASKKIKEFFAPPAASAAEPKQMDDDMAAIQANIDKLSAPPQTPEPRSYTYREWFLHQNISYQPDTTGALPMKANDLQVGGEHYKHKTIQPWDAITAWNLGYLDGNAVKYLARWRQKDGLQDLRKAQHCVSKLIEEEEIRLKEIGVPIPAYGETDTETIALPPPQEDIAADTPADKDITQMAERLAPARVKMKTSAGTSASHAPRGADKTKVKA